MPVPGLGGQRGLHRGAGGSCRSRRRCAQAPAAFDDHFSQARLFYASLTPVEQEHIAQAYTFELGKCYEQSIKDAALGASSRTSTPVCASRSPRDSAFRLPSRRPPRRDPAPSPALSQVGAEWPLDGRIIGIVADDESDLSEVADAVEMIGKNGMVPLVIGPHGGKLGSGKGAVPVSRTFLTMRSVEFDAILVAAPASDPRVQVLLTEAFRHCKAIGGWAAGRVLLEAAGIPAEAPGVVIADDASALFDGLTALMKSHRVWERQV